MVIEPHEVDQIKWLRSLGYKYKEIASFFDVSHSYAVSIVMGRVHAKTPTIDCLGGDTAPRGPRTPTAIPNNTKQRKATK